jgi:sec-independent protein translocase protein TatA
MRHPSEEFVFMVHMPAPTMWLVVIVLAFVLFGAQKLPEAARALGRSTNEFKKGLKEGAEQTPDQPALKE